MRYRRGWRPRAQSPGRRWHGDGRLATRQVADTVTVLSCRCSPTHIRHCDRTGHPVTILGQKSIVGTYCFRISKIKF